MTERVPLVALKNFSYSTRALKAGDTFEASTKDARLLRAIKKAEDAPGAAPARIAAPPAPVARKINELFGGVQPTEEPVEDIAALREEYQTKMGKRAFHGWSADELRQRMADAGEPDSDADE